MSNGVYVKNTTVNNAVGIRSVGTNVTVRVDGSSVIGNGTGLSFSTGGALLTFGNNAVRANGSDGAFLGGGGVTIAGKPHGSAFLLRPIGALQLHELAASATIIALLVNASDPARAETTSSAKQPA